ncbi:NTP transferase domain-containing protein [Candidatus Pacearchaeota archaeon]|nr:NTP transferase domain-containing protein [Candidatus Pacearchaeota archaeon]
MRGVILAGGKGTRLFPLTAVINKHLAPVGSLPMIEYPLHTLTKMGIKEISVVTGGEHFSDIARYLGQLHPDINFSFHYQPEAGGIAQALALVKHVVGNEMIVVILGDNIFEDDFLQAAKNFENSSFGAMFFLKRVLNPGRFGVAEIDGVKIIGIEEKPKQPKTDLAVTGIYFFDSTVFDKISKLKPSWRGEYEITDANNEYIAEGKAGYYLVNGFWSDAGTMDSRKSCEEFVKKGLESNVLRSLSANVEIGKMLIESFGANFKP